MIIVLKQDAPDVQIHEFCRELEGMGLQINDSKGSDTHILGLIGDTSPYYSRRTWHLFRRSCADSDTWHGVRTLLGTQAFRVETVLAGTLRCG